MPQGSVLGPLLFLLYTSELFSILENKLIGYADDCTLMAVMLSQSIIVTVAESLISDLNRVSEWCDDWGKILNVSKTKTMIVSRLQTMHPHSPPLTISGTVLKVSDDLAILGVTFDSKMTFEKYLCSVSRAASQILGILRKSWRVFHDRSLLGNCFRGFVLRRGSFTLCKAVCKAYSASVRSSRRVSLTHNLEQRECSTPLPVLSTVLQCSSRLPIHT